MKKLLVVVDMQNDFVTGSLGTEEAQALIKPMSEFIKNFDGDVTSTQDTHYENYLETQEGELLPVKHCIEFTEGWEIVPEIRQAMIEKRESIEGEQIIPNFEKHTFGALWFGNELKYKWFDYKEIHFVGVCTGICVISNAVIAKSALPEAKIVIHKDLCACVSPESHERALESMKTLQMDII